MRAEPQLVRVKLSVIALEPTPGGAFQVAGTAASRLREILRRHGVPDASVSGSRLTLNSRFDYGPNTPEFLGYHCSASYVFESAALDDLQRLLVDAVEAGAHRIAEVDFDVRDRPRCATRRGAGRLRRRAARPRSTPRPRASRSALWVHIQDVDAEGQRSQGHRQGGGSSASDLAPGMVEVSAAVLLGFSLGRRGRSDGAGRALSATRT